MTRIKVYGENFVDEFNGGVAESKDEGNGRMRSSENAFKQKNKIISLIFTPSGWHKTMGRGIEIK